MSRITIRPAIINSIEDIELILSLTNDAFMADAFFKKPEYHMRFTREDVLNLMKTDHSTFLFAVLTENDSSITVGSLYLQWYFENNKITGKFSAVSIPTKYGNRGFGKKLVQGAENYILNIANSNGYDSAVMEMGVINLRKDLFPWYEKQGYAIIEEIRPNDEEVSRIILDDLDVCCILMRKILK
eukprot:gene17247-22775_t